jgi:hypothetical protein
MPPSERPIPMFAAEPPQEPLPYGRWADALADRFLEAAQDEAESEIGEITWFPERSFAGRTYVPCVAPLSEGGEVCGFVSYSREHEGAQATDFKADAYATEDTAAENPDWKLDLNDEEIAHFRGSQGRRGKVTLVWGQALVPNGAVATAELGPTTTDQCELIEDRFTLVSLDGYTGDYVEVRLYGERGAELAREPLYEEE